MKSTIIVKGMHCKSCDMLVEDSLGDLSGVKSVKSDYKLGKVIVEFDEKKVSLDKIKSTIVEEGYKVD